ncbi:hypothetical protein O0I10_008119 [Lichtheimia ornata]|uniref:PNPLA domain-containing protein n=1 Tax=Lichtheimia ornata TaxID=688661 RepID=A0AAD7XX58_9FUNG|nr:uncharacterized protein O0I10_008119 [Lichtheimia ornata]KAJ8656106.1 hypothetical protein O0I10_008119 [Lichtheimia ornata]
MTDHAQVTPIATSIASDRLEKDPLRPLIVALLCFVYSLFTWFERHVLQPSLIQWRQWRNHQPEHRLNAGLLDAKCYTEWKARAKELDMHLSNDRWKANPVSRVYDYKLIASRLEHLRKAREADDVDCMIYMLRGGLLRNFGGICDRKLFSHSYLGTKTLIEDYMEEMVKQIEYIESTDALDQQAKMKFFSDARQGFGCSALVLQGGTAFALYHLGVLKALHEQGLLPRIISGHAVGAMVAALICIHTDEELPEILQPNGINLQAFSTKTDKGHVHRRITRFLKHGYLMDMKVLQQCVRANVGDLTFEEAYARSKRVLNISVSSSRKEIPPLLNYLTAPNVLIWSAACCSTASVGLFGSCELLAKDTDGNIVKWTTSAVKWNHWSETSPSESEEPLKRLSELFNVNHFIVSQAMTYAIPFASNGHNLQQESMWNRVAYLIASELKHRLYQLDQFHMLPNVFRPVVDEKISGNVTIAPDLSISDFNILFSNPTHASLAYWILNGERATWPLLSFIRTRCMIELALDKAVLRLKAMNVEKEPVVVVPTQYPERKQRARSMH